MFKMVAKIASVRDEKSDSFFKRSDQQKQVKSKTAYIGTFLVIPGRTTLSGGWRFTPSPALPRKRGREQNTYDLTPYDLHKMPKSAHVCHPPFSVVLPYTSTQSYYRTNDLFVKLG
jgi:hypothetical protein